MQVVICYDIRDNRLRYKFVKYLEKLGIRVQLSVFKANLMQNEIAGLDRFAKKLLNNGDYGNVLIYKVQDEFSGTEQRALPDDFIIL